MLWLITEGLSFPGGLSDGRFNLDMLTASSEDVAAHLERAFKVDDRERVCIEKWAAEGFTDPPDPSGINIKIFTLPDGAGFEVPRNLYKAWMLLQSETPAYESNLYSRELIPDETSVLTLFFSVQNAL